jgi:hypothetical protein
LIFSHSPFVSANRRINQSKPSCSAGKHFPVQLSPTDTIVTPLHLEKTR